jgi:glycosyltransferase involved in cell wall biosynthesis
MPRLLAGGHSLLVRNADAVVVHSDSERAAALEMGAHADVLRVIPPAPPIAPGALQVSREAARATLGLLPDVPVVLFFGFVKPYKGLSVLLRSLPELIGAVGSVRLVIAGEIVGSRSRYGRLVAELGVSDSVRWIPGFVPSSDVGTVFAAADVVALPYVAASSSGVLLTAYAFNRPVVATRVGGLIELVQAGEAGVLVPPNDPKALGAAIGDVLGDPGRAERMGAEGFRLTQERFTWTGMARRVDGLYRELLDRSGDNGAQV